MALPLLGMNGWGILWVIYFVTGNIMFYNCNYRSLFGAFHFLSLHSHNFKPNSLGQMLLLFVYFANLQHTQCPIFDFPFDEKEKWQLVVWNLATDLFMMGQKVKSWSWGVYFGTALKNIPYGCVSSLPKYNSLTSMKIFLRLRGKIWQGERQDLTWYRSGEMKCDKC